MKEYLTGYLGKGLKLQKQEQIRINGMDAVTGQARVQGRKGEHDLRLTAMQYDADTFYHFVFITRTEATGAQALGLKRTTYSFRKLSAAEAAELEPKRIRLHKVRSGDTAEKLAAGFPFEDFRLERFNTLNGLRPGEGLKVGQTVKLITQ